MSAGSKGTGIHQNRYRLNCELLIERFTYSGHIANVFVETRCLRRTSPSLMQGFELLPPSLPHSSASLRYRPPQGTLVFHQTVLENVFQRHLPRLPACHRLHHFHRVRLDLVSFEVLYAYEGAVRFVQHRRRLEWLCSSLMPHRHALSYDQHVALLQRGLLPQNA